MSHHEHKVITAYLIMEIAMKTLRSTTESLSNFAELFRMLIVPHVL